MLYVTPSRNFIDDTQIKKAFCRHVGAHFRFPIEERITIKSDTNQFNPDADSYFYEQSIGKRPVVHEVYWDGVWICDYTDNDNVINTVNKFLFGFKNAYEAKQISLNSDADYKEIAMKEQIRDALIQKERENTKNLEKAERKVDALPERDEAERLTKQVLKEIIEDKKQFKQKKGKKK